MQALKALVIFMGILIVLGMGLFAWGISTKLGDMAETGSASPRVAFWDAPVNEEIPPGAVVVETRTEGGRLIVRLTLKNGDSRILLYNLQNGDWVGEIRLNQSEGAQ